MPFAIAWLFAIIIRPLSTRVQKRINLPHKLVSAILLIAFLTVVGCALFFAGSKIFSQTSNFLNELTKDLDSPDNDLRRTLDFFIGLKDKIPFLSKMMQNTNQDQNTTAMLESIYSMLTDITRDGIQKISSMMASWAGSFIKSLPGAVFFLVVSIVSMFYITFDYTKITDFFKRILPDKWMSGIVSLKTNFLSAIAGYCKAYMLLMFVTFTELFAGFLILDINYSLILALLISVLDLLPVIGAGSFLIPWSAVMFITGNVRMGWGLLIIFGIMYVVRQIAEPRIVGNCIGVHPLATLFSVYAGFKLFGLVGMIAGPVIALTIKLFVYRENE